MSATSTQEYGGHHIPLGDVIHTHALLAALLLTTVLVLGVLCWRIVIAKGVRHQPGPPPAHTVDEWLPGLWRVEGKTTRSPELLYIDREGIMAVIVQPVLEPVTLRVRRLSRPGVSA